MQPNPGVSTERTGEGVTYSLGVRWRKGGLCKWTAGKTQPPSSRASSCRPRLPAWMTVVRAERKAGRPSPCPWVWRPGGHGREQEGAGCGPGPCGGKGRGRKLASPSFLLSEAFAQTVHLMMSSPRCREAMCLRLQLARLAEAVRPCLGPRALHHHGRHFPACVWNQHRVNLFQTLALYSLQPLPSTIWDPPPPRTLDSPCSAFILTIEDHFIDSGKRQKGVF